MNIKAPRGTRDVLPEDIYKWHYVENIIRKACSRFGFEEIRTPVFENTELFLRGVGDTTDIVQKEMYTFNDKGGRSITLKPEGTASVARAFVENKMYAKPQPTKLYYIYPLFRYERPQAGRLRQHHQFGVEVFGTMDPSIDAEIINLAMVLFDSLGIKGLELNINSIGCPKCRVEYNKALKQYLEDRVDKLCKDCNERLARNPLRVLDCKNKTCKEIVDDAPVIIDYLCGECDEHFDKLKRYLDTVGLSYKINPKIVRGLDYYTKTVFEIISTDIGAQGTVCGGGRYDGLVSEIGGPDVPGIGFGLGIERLLLAIENQNITIPEPQKFDFFVVCMKEGYKMYAFDILQKIRYQGYSADMDHMSRSMRAQFKYADKLDAKYVIIIGDDEVKNRVVSLKNMETGEQIQKQLEDILSDIKNRKDD